ncbi:MAG: helix-turn-helix transcriptional regulator [Eubacteriales bacterium]|jgi:transcriptional regulator with XRE-family HTH domain|nr:helix-turn-helix transcriptional regulator [Eubacteriales bacterium]
MKKTMHTFPERLKDLRDRLGYTQSDLAKKLSITRASVNAWEMGISAPSTSWLVELSNLFHVTTDYLLGLDDCITIRTNTLSDRAVTAILNTVEAFYENCKEL